MSNSTSLGAYNFEGIEDVELSPLDGKIYFAAKGPGRVYRFTDNGTNVINLEVFVENTIYDVDPGTGVVNASWGVGNDNMAFDGEGNLWVLQDGRLPGDGGSEDNHIWVVGPTHTAASPRVRIFARTPLESEPTGITFTPDYKFMFISFMHPSPSNSSSQTDAAGVSVVFNTHTTVVIARTENLGPGSTLPVKFTDFNVKAVSNEVQVNWSVTDVQNHSFFAVERSVNGINFQEIHKNTQSLSNGTNYTFSFIDRQPSSANVLYYRIKQCDIDGSCNYSETKSVKILNKEGLSIYPNPAYNNINVAFNATEETFVTLLLFNKMGQTVRKETKKVFAGTNTISLNIQQLAKGNYTISIDDGKTTQKEKIVKL
ncbi:MAG: T9SS type A sorting domain-containing protein [Chitinophagaceae bacterium]